MSETWFLGFFRDRSEPILAVGHPLCRGVDRRKPVNICPVSILISMVTSGYSRKNKREVRL